MKKILIICMSAVLLTACDGHQNFPDTAMKVGHILCTDGSVLSYNDYAQSGKEAAGVVFHLNQDGASGDKGYAVALHDIEAEAFADSLGIGQGTSGSVSAYDGNANTFALYSTKDIHSPLAERVFEIWQYGQSAYIPSVAQMRLLYGAKDRINPYMELCGGEPITDYPEDCWYWTSTEVSGQQSAKAWLYSLGSGTMQETSKVQRHRARAMITLEY